MIYDGGEGQCITFYSNKDLQKLEKFMQGKPVAEQEIGKQLLLETAAYAESSICRRKSLLHYFGEEYTEENCGNCDNCLNPKKQVEAQDSLCAVIEAIIAVKENFKADYIIDILLGKETSEVLAHKHEELEVFGSGMGEEEKMWNAVIRQALIAGYLSKDVENYGLLKVTFLFQKVITFIHLLPECIQTLLVFEVTETLDGALFWGGVWKRTIAEAIVLP